MFISCSIDLCPSKSGECKNGNGHVTIFSFPRKESENYDAWINAVEPYLKKARPNRKNLYICQYHFHESYLFNENRKIWKDGVKVIIPRKKLQLKKDAVPSIFNVPKNPEHQLGSIEIEQNDLKNNKQIANKEVLKSIIKTETSPDDSQHNANTSTTTTKVDVYTNEDLIRDWEKMQKESVLEKWGMVRFSDSNIIFAYCNDSADELTISRSVSVGADMTTKLQVFGRYSTFPVKEKITSFEDIISILTKVMCLRLCEDVSCSSGIFEPKLRSKSKKCRSCQNKKRRKDKREAARLKRQLDRRVKNKKV